MSTARPHVPPAGFQAPGGDWMWHLDGKVAGRSQGQFPHAAPHGCMFSKDERHSGECQVITNHREALQFPEKIQSPSIPERITPDDDDF